MENITIVNENTVKGASRANVCGTISLTMALISIIFNPLYILPNVAFILGVVGLIVGLVSKKSVGSAVAGIITSIVAVVIQIVVDTVLTLISLGLLGFVFLI